MSDRQVNLEHYDFKSYVNSKRWNSYYCQIMEIIECINAKKVLIIGTGDGIVPNIIRMLDRTIEVSTFDIDEALNPDICGDIEQLSLVLKQKYDLIVCCQVCEHINFSKFDKILNELRKSVIDSGGKLVLSLPVRYFTITVWVDFPPIHLHFVKNISRFWERDFSFDGQHYWEIGPRRYSKSVIRKKIKKYFQIVKEYHVPNNPYHYFYICVAN